MQIFTKFCFIFMQTWGVYTAWWSGNTNKNIFVKIFHWIQISNIFISRQLTEYEYWIYSFLATEPNLISNIFVPRYLTKYKYQKYLFWAIWTNMNIEYLQYKLLMTASPRKVNIQQDLPHIYAYTWVVSAACWPEYTTTDIFIIRFYHKQILNMFIFGLLPNTNIRYIHSLQPDQIWISNIFVLRNLAKYEYWIYWLT